MDCPPSLPGAVLCRFVLSLTLALVTIQPGHAQLSSLKSAVEGSKPREEKAPEKPEEIRQRLELWQKQARDTLTRLEDSDLVLPAGITPGEFDDRRRDLEQMVVLTASSLKSFNAGAEARKAAETARAEDAAWTGFDAAPPYSILMLDELLNERDATEAKLVSRKSSLANFQHLLTTTVEETKVAEDAVSAMAMAVQNAENGDGDAAKWRLEAARTRSRLMAVRAGYLQMTCDALKDRIAASEADLALLERKVRTATPNTRFGEEDLAKVGKITGERKQSLEKELNAVSKRLKSALAERARAQSALDELPAASADGKQPDGLELAKFRLEVAEGRIESLQSVTEGLEGLVQLENVNRDAYQYRHSIVNDAGSGQRDKGIESLELITERLRAWVSVLSNESTTCGAELSKIESKAASITAEDPRFPLLNEQRAARSEKLAMLQRVKQAVVAQRKLLQRWLAEYEPQNGETGLFGKMSSIASGIWKNAGKAWAYEIMSFEEKVEVDGQTITGRIPVTVGMLMRALLFFFIGYRGASYIASRIQKTMVGHGHIAEGQARTLRNWAMIAVGAALVLCTLSLLKIPLTVFAFFGGALAIGIGFGTQTLIKNFISGIIVLAERKVRVGDILDVDGVVGTVVEVNTRSSIIRGPDDVETMIPNSLFLENRVTNWTLSSSKMRRNLRVGVAYGSDTRLVMDILTEAAGRHGKVCKDPEPFAVFEDFGDNALVFVLYFWVEMGGATNAMIVTSDLRLMIEKRLNEAGIGVPFPQRDLHIKTDQPIDVRMTDER